MSQASAQPNDPYNQPPSFVSRHIDQVWAVSIFLITTLLTVVSFPPFRAPELAYAMVAPAVFWAYLRPSFRLYALTLLGSQVVAWTVILAWLHHVTWVGLFLLGPFMGCWVGLWFLAAWWVMPRMLGRPTPNRLIAMLGLAAVWVLIEWTRTWLLSGFPWLPLAASQWTMVSMLQVASYTGAGGLSFVIVAVNLGFAAYAHRLFKEGRRGFNKRSQEFFLSLFLVLVCFSLHIQAVVNRGKFTVPMLRVAVVQPYIPQAVKWDEAKAAGIMAVLEETTLRAAEQRPDLILWPEATTPYAVPGNPDMQRWTESLVARAGVPLLMGSVMVEKPGTPDEAWYNGAVLIDPAKGLSEQRYAKRHLVPFGEYVPMRWALGWLTKVTEVGEGDFQHGKDPDPVLISTASGAFAAGPLICYEDIFPDLSRTSALAGSDFLAVLTNNAWYGEGGAAYQHAAHSVLRAVETRRPVLRCGNGGWSGWIDEYGAIRAEVKRTPGGAVITTPVSNYSQDEVKAASVYFRGVATMDVTRDRRLIGKQSYYVEHGDWFVTVCAVLSAFAFFLLRGYTPVVASVTDREDESIQ